jgi:hypothetical protein
MSKNISHKIYPQGGIDCLEDKCPFKRECANHYTAGEFRTEGGFTPELSLLRDILICDTFNKNIINVENRAMLPENFHDLRQGAIVLDKDGELISSEVCY